MKSIDAKKLQGDEDEDEAGPSLVGKKRTGGSKGFANSSFA